MGAIVTAQIHYHTHHHLHNSLADIDDQQQSPFPSSPIMPPPAHYYLDSPPHFPNPPQIDTYLPSPSPPPLSSSVEPDFHHNFPSNQEIRLDQDLPSIHGLSIGADEFHFAQRFQPEDRFPPEDQFPSDDRFPSEDQFPPEFLPSIAPTLPPSFNNLPPSLMLELPSAESSRRTRWPSLVFWSRSPQ